MGTLRLPSRDGRRFAEAMSCFTNGLGNRPSLLIKGYPWASIGNGTGTVVDVGGSKGSVCDEIAQAVPGLKFLIQDLPDMIRGAKETITSDFTGRIEFMEHDFFTEQPIKADAYLLRCIFHNWADSNVIKILRALVPALRSGVKIIVNDFLIPEPGTMSLSKERAIRYANFPALSIPP